MDTLKQLLPMLSSEEFNKFATDYASAHPEMVQAMAMEFKNRLDGTEDLDIEQEARDCLYTYVIPTVKQRRMDWQASFVDWTVAAPRIRRFACRATAWMQHHDPSKVVNTGLNLLRSIAEQVRYEVNSDRDWEGDEDFGIDTVVDIIEQAALHERMPRQDAIKLPAQLEKIARHRAFFFIDSTGVLDLARKITRHFTPVDQQLKHLNNKYKNETNDWKRDSLLGEMWEVMMDNDRTSDAITLYNEHPDSHSLNWHYGAWLEQQHRLDEAVEVYENFAQCNYDAHWHHALLRVYKAQGDKKHIASTLQRMLHKHVGNVDDNLDELKPLIPASEWDAQVDAIIKTYDRDSTDDKLCALLVHEHRTLELFNRIKKYKFDKLDLIETHKDHLTPEQVTQLTQSLKMPKGPDGWYRDEFIATAQYLRRVANLCPEGKRMATQAANYMIKRYGDNYENRGLIYALDDAGFKGF